ncbi:MAG: YdcF family protein [Bacillota bacterium]
MENYKRSYGEPGYVSRGYDGLGQIKLHNKRRRRWKKVIVLLAMLLLLYLFHAPLLAAVGSALIAEDSRQQGDVIVVLMGGVPDRIVQGVELYREGLAEKIVMVRSHDFTNFKLVETLALEIPGMVDINRDIALQLGVPKQHIVILEGRADSTRDEALAVRSYLQAHELYSLLLVTSRYHSLRAKKTFEQVLGKGYRVISLPSPYDPYDPHKWWTERRQLRDVFFEYQKLLNLYVFKK